MDANVFPAHLLFYTLILLKWLNIEHINKAL